MLLIVIMILGNNTAARNDYEHDHDQEHDWAGNPVYINLSTLLPTIAPL
jgi:predicted metal-dependent HD superfamily phosphohydrolase